MFYEAEPDGYARIAEGVHLKTLVHGDRTLLSEVRFDKGGLVPAHHHVYEQTGYLVSGSLRFVIGHETRIAKQGDSWNIPSDVVHSAEALEKSVVIEVFSPAREDYLPESLGARRETGDR